eukprot:TRINITY_DN5834_c0_g1_i4.p1 TRINITY_DN5834_c0_g1~~TRINITY_DN5834_c0_g1_i4.p1  ORF type:complete len:613 (+),score=161.43 TRINITY_DN5834_c0_g1_i4:88-1839(+)
MASDAAAGGDGLSARIVAFKNGYGFVALRFSRKAVATQGMARVAVPVPGEPVHGSVWIDVDSADHRLLGFDVMAPGKQSEEQQRCGLLDQEFSSCVVVDPIPTLCGIPRLLKANLGKVAKLTVLGAGKEPERLVEGKLLKVDAATVILLGSAGGHEVVQATDVRRFSIDGEMNTDTEEQPPQRQVNLSVACADGSAEVTGTVLLFTKGLTWAPSYRVSVNREAETVTLRGQAALLCELDGLGRRGVRVERLSLAAGFPTFSMEQVRDPSLCAATLEVFLRELQGGGGGVRAAMPLGHRARRMQEMRAPARQMMMQNVMTQQVDPSMDLDDDEGAEGEVGGRHEDLYLYQPSLPSAQGEEGGAISLLKHKRWVLPIIQAPPVAFEDVYHVDVPQDGLSSNVPSHSSWGGPPGQAGDGGLIPVMHQLRFRNEGNCPLTTAPVLVTSGESVVAQTTIRFTPPRQQCKVDLTRAMDVIGRCQSRRVGEPKGKVVGARGSFFSSGGRQVMAHTVEVLVSVQNTKTVPVLAVVEATVVGTLTQAQPKEKEARPSAIGLGSLNDRVALTWEITIAPKTTGDVRFQYEQVM